MVSKNSNKQNMKAILTGLPEDVSIDKVVEHPHSLELCVSWDEPSDGKRFCNNCGSNRCVKKDSGTYQTIRHLPIGQKPYPFLLFFIPFVISPSNKPRIIDVSQRQSPIYLVQNTTIS